MNNKLLSFLKFFIGWPLSSVALFFIFKTVLSNSPEILSYVKTPTLPLLAGGILCFFSYYILRAIVWKILLKESGHDIALKESTYLWGLAELKRYVPGNIWSFLTKTLSFEEKGVERKIITKLLFIEIGMFLLSCLIFSLLGLNFLSKGILPENINFFYPTVTPFVIIVLLLYIFNKRIIPKNNNKLSIFIRFFLPDFKPAVIVNLLLINLLFLFFYGLGYFLIISSVIYLPVNQSLSLIGFFVFSLLTGYLSFITPMGLGVREGMVTLGLTKFLTVGIAGFSSIFARINLIITEIIFIVFIYAWRNSKSKFLSGAEKFISKNLHLLMLLIFVSLYIFYFTSISFLRYDNFFTGRFDLGNMDQTIWNTVHGRIFQFTDPNGTDTISRLAYHADFILILISPLYLIWSNPKVLLLLQSFVLGLGAYFVYQISKDILKNRNISLILALSYLLNPSTQFSNLYDFHPVTLATTFLLGTFYFVRRNRYLWFFIFLTLSVLCKEQIWVVSAIFGLYIFFIKNKKLLGSAIAFISLGAFYYTVTYLIPGARGSEHFALSYYSELGDTPFTVIKNFIIDPVKTIMLILQGEPILYLYKLFMPVGFIPFASPASLLFAAPDFFINLLSNNSQLRDLYYQYTSAITPFIFISAIYSVRFLTHKFSKISISFFVWYLIFFALVSAYFIGPLPLSKNPSVSVFTEQLKNRNEISKFLANIPEEYSIAATNNLGSHLSRRQNIYIIPLGMKKADIIVFLLNDKFAQPSLPAQKELAQSLKQDKRYFLLYESGDFIVFKKYVKSSTI